MRIIFAITNLKNGGAERALIVFANQLAGMGEDVHIVCTEEEGNDYAVDERVTRHLIRLPDVRIPKVRGFCNILFSVLQIRKLAGDVIIPFYPPLLLDYGVRFRLAAIFSKTRVVYALRCGRERQLSAERDNWLYKLAYYSADRIWIQTPRQSKYFPASLQKKIFCVPNIIDSRFLEIPRTYTDKISRFISVGRIHPQKNQKMLLEAFADMIARTGNREATLTIYGKCAPEVYETELELRAYIRQRHLEERVFLAGRVTRIEEKYEQADAFVFSSDYEGCPNALMEAMAAGLPCVSTDCPTGPADLIENEKNGWLIPVGDVRALSEKMEYLTANPRAANRAGAAARERMREWGSAEEIAAKLLQYIRR